MRIGAAAGTDRGTLGIGYTSLTGVGVNGLAVSGNVGIGTSSPAARLQVNAPNTTAASLTFGATAGQIFRNENSELALGLSSSSPFNFYIQGRTNTNTSRDLIIQPVGGNVGIGTTTNLGKLHVNGATSQATILALSGNSNAVYPSDSFGGGIGYNFSAGGGEVDFWNNWTGATGTAGGFTFRRLTGVSSQIALLTIDGTGITRINSNSGSISHLFQFNENGGEINLYNNTGNPGTLIDLSSGATRMLHVLSTGNQQIGIGSGNTTGVVQFMRAGFVEAMRIDSSGNVLVTNAGGGLGYGTGSGGTVTQATNKSTTVTLNKPTGQITMNNAALGAGASVNFQLSNSLLAASDSIVVQPSFGANSQTYTAQATFCGSGAAYIRVTNTSGGSLSEAVTLNFAIIKGATA